MIDSVGPRYQQHPFPEFVLRQEVSVTMMGEKNVPDYASRPRSQVQLLHTTSKSNHYLGKLAFQTFD